ncbi:glyceraldehyde-3-phosphate dehydrogenase [Halalkalibacterium halodurans]|uniref:Glyceraldehyde-3-phosphate dehydrogenase n=1 Tax=Halalkalibacterium halodurans (strain ATCC BAA-125 / DSM 18197 / FERM 7344 / JCM 9153 / C-125) TaxID=272558 RepID=Q9K858_HALH5|nr:glyceraldehyde-3-phosphate dehydrogenase [Halalkalibacterium halodurans]MDY7223682.1 glyceraldehyde-3-phosphate dehydrogenase [Halalkalibacterium halodurans]MDY7242903.1 glyceraldehyde-3-phosphate dehydrogenase [Halalkalibacterium halodurans]MED4082131.1 glyceraldehyde-3-phosphate dehydrogenase [Halalkalibacterium halodurans]MED4084291.1 glyceraldehyde-3-phosphate dehydrogenase [Halalkalibacterium halodurans]MED4103600.1 glyceraldehyde-3-phosphate dehydrogenase [Halalkalibacterium haloduran
MKVKVAINGFGRIGRMVFRKAVENKQFDVVAINASYPAETLAHLIKYDSVHGPFQGTVEIKNDALVVNGKEIKLVNSRDPRVLPWKDLEVDIVVEATGKFKTKETAGYHLEAGAKKVIITAPGKNEDVTVVVGVNENDYKPEEHHVLSNASCTTNCLAPVAKVLDEAFTIQSGMMTTVHAYTNDQKNIDNPHKDLRRARACGQSIIPTSTGAAKAISKVLPQLEGKLTGMALRVPTPNVSLVDLVVQVKEDVTPEKVNHVLKQAAAGSMKGILGFTEEPLVSIDFNGNEHSAIVDGLSTMVMEDTNQVKVLAWYDNEWGYSTRVVDLVELVAKELKKPAKVIAS